MWFKTNISIINCFWLDVKSLALNRSFVLDSIVSEEEDEDVEESTDLNEEEAEQSARD